MRYLTVLYDPSCALCCRAALWLNDQPKYVPLYFCAAGSEAALAYFPGIDHAATVNQLTVVGDGGEVYYNERGWLMCLWATKSYRATALRFAAKPERLDQAKRLVLWVSRHRKVLGSLVA